MTEICVAIPTVPIGDPQRISNSGRVAEGDGVSEVCALDPALGGMHFLSDTAVAL